MSFAQWTKDYGTMAGCFALAASISYATYAVTSRFDEVKDIAATANQTIQDVKAVQVSMREDLTALKANLPGAGVAAGEAGANAVTTMEEMLACPADKPDCEEDTGLRGAVRRKLEGLRP